MAQQQVKRVCKCENCGNEAEMVVTCSLEPEEPDTGAASDAPAKPAGGGRRVKGTATCTQCGNEADMWIDL